MKNQEMNTQVEQTILAIRLASYSAKDLASIYKVKKSTIKKWKKELTSQNASKERAERLEDLLTDLIVAIQMENTYSEQEWRKMILKLKLLCIEAIFFDDKELFTEIMGFLNQVEWTEEKRALTDDMTEATGNILRFEEK